MLSVCPKPILEHILQWLSSSGIRDAVISTGYLGRMIEEYFGNGSELGIKVSYAKSVHPLGTAGQLKATESKIRGRFLCLYGDALLRFDLKRAVEFHAARTALATMVLMKYSTELKYGFMETDEDGRLTEWREKPTVSGFINTGCFVMEKRFLRYIPRVRTFEMNVAFERARKAGERLFGVKVEGEFVDIGDRESYRDANEQYMQKIGKVL
jgi:mannose-1-phosphate guanylyltransferase